MTQVLAKIRKRIGTAAQWQAANPVLALGEEGFESDTRRYKVGDGTTEFNDLIYEPYSLILKEDIENWNSKQDPISNASETEAGIVIRAQNEEALAGSDTEKYITPHTLKNAIDSAIALLILNSPGSLDTLDELAAALGDDPNFSTTVLAAISERIRIDQIVNDLVSNYTNRPLSAAQGKVLNDLLSALTLTVAGKIPVADIINSLTSDITNRPLSAAQGKALKNLIDTLPSKYNRKIFRSHVADIVGSATASEEIYLAVQINGNEVVSGDSIDVETLWTFSSASSTQKQFYIRASAANSLTGIAADTIMANIQNNNSGGTTIPVKLKQDITVKSVVTPPSSLEAAFTNTAASTQGVLTVINAPNIDLTNTWYILITARKALVADVITLKSVKVFINKS